MSRSGSRLGKRRPRVLGMLVAALAALTLSTSTVVGAPVIKSLGDLNAGSSDSQPGSFTKLGNKIIFVARDETKGMELWRTDGTAAGTKIIKDINPSGDSWPNGFEVLNGYAYFAADNGGGGELWRTDGTATGTKKVKDANGDPDVESTDDAPFKFGNLLYYYANDGEHGLELWRSDGTANGTKMLKDIKPGNGSSAYCCPEQLGDTVLFAADDGTHGIELWKTDGTRNGTSMVLDVIGGPNSSYPLNTGTVAGARYYFCDANQDLWVTDGTTAGTEFVKTFDYCVNPVAYGDDVLVEAAVGFNVELWRSNGTPDGTQMVTELNPVGDAYPNPLHNEPINGNYFYAASDGTHGRELFVYDGATLTLVEDINPTDSSDPSSSGNPTMELGNRLVFEVDDGTNGHELWITDGTEPGTFMLRDIAPGSASSDPYPLGVINGVLYFAAENATYGRELWRTNGTTTGTKRVTDINAGPGSSNPDGEVVGGKLYLVADDGTHGREPYRLTP